MPTSGTKRTCPIGEPRVRYWTFCALENLLRETKVSSVPSGTVQQEVA
jgi:hypothetical protein